MTFWKASGQTEVPWSAAVSCKSADQSLHRSRHNDETAALTLQRHGFITVHRHCMTQLLSCECRIRAVLLLLKLACWLHCASGTQESQPSLIHTVVPTECNPYQDWQAGLPGQLLWLQLSRHRINLSMCLKSRCWDCTGPGKGLEAQACLQG